jgi:hypothetical protein
MMNAHLLADCRKVAGSEQTSQPAVAPMKSMFIHEGIKVISK